MQFLLLIVFEYNKHKLTIDLTLIINDYLTVGNTVSILSMNASNLCLQIFIVADKCLHGINKIVIEFWSHDFLYNKIKLQKRNTTIEWKHYCRCIMKNEWSFYTSTSKISFVLEFQSILWSRKALQLNSDRNNNYILFLIERGWKNNTEMFECHMKHWIIKYIFT